MTIAMVSMIIIMTSMMIQHGPIDHICIDEDDHDYHAKEMLPGINILSTPYDHVLHPTNNLSISVLVNYCCVPENLSEVNICPRCNEQS